MKGKWGKLFVIIFGDTLLLLFVIGFKTWWIDISFGIFGACWTIWVWEKKDKVDDDPKKEN